MTSPDADRPDESTPGVTATDLMQAALPHVPFDGWSPATFAAACRDLDIGAATGRALCPRGATDLAVLFHRDGDRRMAEAYRVAATEDMRIREKIALAVRLRLEAADDKEAVRRSTALFSLPHMAPQGARLIWETADAIWTALDDPSEDINWYTKRATLSGVYGSVVLFWLGDDSAGQQATHDFIDRRIDEVLKVEKLKAQVRQNRFLRPLTAPLEHLGSLVKAPTRMPKGDLPGSWVSPRH